MGGYTKETRPVLNCEQFCATFCCSSLDLRGRYTDSRTANVFRMFILVLELLGEVYFLHVMGVYRDTLSRSFSIVHAQDASGVRCECKQNRFLFESLPWVGT